MNEPLPRSWRDLTIDELIEGWRTVEMGALTPEQSIHLARVLAERVIPRYRNAPGMSPMAKLGLRTIQLGLLEWADSMEAES